MKKITMKMTIKQAETLMLASEILSRLGMGQFRIAMEQLPLKKKSPNRWADAMDDISWILKEHMVDDIDGWFTSLTIHSEQVSPEARIAFDLYQSIRHRVFWEKAVDQGLVKSVDSPRRIPEMIQVWYDKPMYVADEPAVEITVTED